MSVISDLFAGGAEGVFKGVSSIIKDFKADPTEVVKLQAALQQAQLDLDAKLAQADAQVLSAINASMQAEAKSEHWLQFSWRPLTMLVFGVTVLNNYVLYAYLAKYGVVQIVVPDSVWGAFLAIGGVAAYVRGRDK